MSRLSTCCYSGRLPAAHGVVFTLLSDPLHLDALTPPWFRIQPLGEVPGDLDAGTTISYRLRWRGLAMPWTSLLTDWHGPDHFAYEQIEGPYRFFRHEHYFRAHAGETEIEDRVVFRTQGGALVDRVIAAPELRRIFSFREQRARALLLAVPNLASAHCPSLSSTTAAVQRETLQSFRRAPSTGCPRG